jgi:SAM-dependent methyltransferase
MTDLPAQRSGSLDQYEPAPPVHLGEFLGSADGPEPSGMFVAPAAAYDRYMGRYVPELAPALADAAGVVPGMRVLDVGCGPGGLTTELVARVGAEKVAAIDPAPQFVAACRYRHPGVDVRQGVAEYLPWSRGWFDAVLSSLVFGFLSDPDLAVREMMRVTRPGGVVAACMWDGGDGMTMLRLFWTAMAAVDPTTVGEAGRPGRTAGDITRRFRAAGMTDVTDGELAVRATYTGFDDFWDPFTLGVGPAGQALAELSAARRAVVRETCRAALPAGPFSLSARAWYATGGVPDSARSAGAGG